jgi:hypothetical protein
MRTFAELSGFNHDSIVRQEGIIACKTVESFLASGMSGVEKSIGAEGLTG